MTTQAEPKIENEAADFTTADKPEFINRMFQAGVHFGHKKSKWNPKMTDYVYGVRNNVHVIDLNKTYDLLRKALDYLENLAAEGGAVLFVGTRTHASALTKETAEATGMPYVDRRWVGGTFTNFDVVGKRLDYYRKLEKDFAAGVFEKYTKREQLEIKREIETLKVKWGGLKNLTALPKAIFVVDMAEDGLAVKEARERGMVTLAFSDTNADPSLVNYPIPANDDSISSVKLILGEVTKAILRGKQKVPAINVKNPK